MARFHHYSWLNVCLIASQRPTATRVAGFQTWRSLKRHVRRGEKGIAILAPMVARRDREGDVDETRGRHRVQSRVRVRWVISGFGSRDGSAWRHRRLQKPRWRGPCLVLMVARAGSTGSPRRARSARPRGGERARAAIAAYDEHP
jgi:hypothetical protein